MVRAMMAVAVFLFGLSVHSEEASRVEEKTTRVPDRGNEEQIAVGSKLERVVFKDLRLVQRELKDLGKAKAYAMVWIALDCPVAKRYLPILADLATRYREKSVEFLVLAAGPEDSPNEVAYESLQQGGKLRFGMDFGGKLAQQAGVTRTPEVVVLDDQGIIRYRGRIDRKVRVSGIDPKPVREDLQLALDELLAGHQVEVSETSVEGCPLEFEAPSSPSELTYAEDIEPLISRHCRECHQLGQSAPFSLLNYDDAISHGATIAEVVQEQRMPPWFASSVHGTFENQRGLSARERRTILEWVAGGMASGDLTKIPTPVSKEPQQWKIGDPDLVIKALQPYQVPATGTIPYSYIVLPYVFPKDTWVQGIEILPSVPGVVHHANLAFIKLGGEFSNENFITGYVPGGEAMVLREGVAFRIPQGSVLGLQIHYVPNGKETKERIQVGLRYARERVQKQLYHMQVANLRFEIPPHAHHHEVKARRTFPCNATGVGMYCHMHLRGKDMTFVSHSPEGEESPLLCVPNYHFDWQQPYRWNYGSKKFSKGTEIEVLAHFDNSSWNPFNPAPEATVKEGQQTTDEMMYGFLFYTDDDEKLELEIDPKTGYQR